MNSTAWSLTSFTSSIPTPLSLPNFIKLNVCPNLRAGYLSNCVRYKTFMWTFFSDHNVISCPHDKLDFSISSMFERNIPVSFTLLTYHNHLSLSWGVSSAHILTLNYTHPALTFTTPLKWLLQAHYWLPHYQVPHCLLCYQKHLFCSHLILHSN